MVISPVFRVAKNFMGSLYTCPKYPSISGMSILMDRWIRIHWRTVLISVLVMLTMLNTRIIETSKLFNPYGRISSINILLNIEDAMPSTVRMTELAMA